MQLESTAAPPWIMKALEEAESFWGQLHYPAVMWSSIHWCSRAVSGWCHWIEERNREGKYINKKASWLYFQPNIFSHLLLFWDSEALCAVSADNTIGLNKYSLCDLIYTFVVKFYQRRANLSRLTQDYGPVCALESASDSEMLWGMMTMRRRRKRPSTWPVCHVRNDQWWPANCQCQRSPEHRGVSAETEWIHTGGLISSPAQTSMPGCKCLACVHMRWGHPGQKQSLPAAGCRLPAGPSKKGVTVENKLWQTNKLMLSSRITTMPQQNGGGGAGSASPRSSLL